MSIAFVTGSTGLLGSNLVRRLLSDGWHVRALARDPNKFKSQFRGTAGGPLEPVIGDLLEPATYQHALPGVDVVFHTAAYFRESYQGGVHDDQLERVNVGGTLDLLNAVAAANIDRFIHTSSIATIRNEPHVTLGEDDLAEPGDAVDAYYRSKILTDRAVAEFAQREKKLKVYTVLPGWMHGPGDSAPTSAGQFVRDYLSRKLPGVVDASFSFVDARDVAEVMIAAAARGIPGRRYLAAGRAMHMRDLMHIMQHVSGVQAPTRSLPRSLLTAIAFLQEGYARLTGRPVLLSLATVRNIAGDHSRQFSARRARDELGVNFRPVEETVADAVRWHQLQMKQP